MAKKISFDYESIKNRVKEQLSRESEWSSFLDYGAIDNIISSLANELSYEIQYSEYSSIENFWNMARNRSSLLQMSPMHGYIVPRKQGSVGTVRISTSETFDSSHNYDIPIPKFFQMSGDGGNIYVCTTTTEKETTLTQGTNYIDVPCKQGEYKNLIATARGIQYEEYTILDDSIDNSFFELRVNDEVWNYTDSLFLNKADDKVFQIRTLPNLKGVVIRFGNGVYGKKLEKDDNVEFKYISTKGANGNIYKLDVIDKIESSAEDTHGDYVKLYCTNITAFVGGKDYPELNEIREVSPKVYQTGNRASSISDYETILKREFSEFKKISVWGAYETLKDNNQDVWDFIPSKENVIHFALLDSTDTPINERNDATAKKNEIINYLHPICDPTDLFNFEDTEIIPMIFHVDGKLKSTSYIISDVISSIKNTLNSNYGIDVVNFGDNVYDSDYVRLIDEVNGVDNHISYVELYKEGKFLTAIVSGSYQGSFYLPIYPIDYKSVKFYIKNNSVANSIYEEFATCNYYGNIEGVGVYLTPNSQLNLNNGNGILNISSELMDDNDAQHYTIKIVYQSIDKNIINTSRSNILCYEDAIINLTY